MIEHVQLGSGRKSWLAAAMLGILACVAQVRAADDSSSPAAQKVTFTKDVAPIFQAHCVVCHRPNDIAPMSLLSYEETRPWVKSIRKAVADRVMPPWHADPQFGHFSNERKLADKDVATIESWIAQGALEGDPADMPKVKAELEGEWRLGTPDLIVSFPEQELAAGGPDQFRDLPAKIDISEDKWVQAIEFKPGNRKVVHHIIAFLRTPDKEGEGPQGWLGAWAAGMEPMVFDQGSGRLLKKGTTVIGDMHYHPTDKPAKDISRVGIYFAKEPVKKEVINLWIQNAGFEIPAGDANHEVTSTHTFDEDSTILGLLPHMHYRGKDFVYTATFPDGRRETLLKVNKYDFNWQTVYKLAEPIKAPKGTKIDCVAHYDNSANNKANPDPKKNVRFGNESYDEMMIGFVDYTVDSGLRPKSANQVIAEKMKQLVTEHPGEVYKVKGYQVGEKDGIETVLYFPAKGTEGGQILIPNNGTPMKGEFKNIQRIGPAFMCKIVFAGLGTLPCRGLLDAKTHTIKGTIDLSAFKSKDLMFEGGLAKIDRPEL